MDTRQFIYRIWDKQAEKYVMTGSLYGCEGVAGLSQYFNRNTHTIEEYSGLNDKNGVRIFEGDIIEFKAQYKQDGCVEVIYWGGSYGCVVHDESGLKELWQLSHIIQQHYPVVIGNRNEDFKLI